MILVTGATGLNGTEVVRCLSARGVPVRALVRDVRKAHTLTQLPGVTVVEGDMSQPETLRELLRDVDRAMLISSADPRMAEVQLNFVAGAREAGVAHVVKLSGIMPDLDSPFRFARMHGEVERALEMSGMAYTHLRAGEFMQAYFRQAADELCGVRPTQRRGFSRQWRLSCPGFRMYDRMAPFAGGHRSNSRRISHRHCVATAAAQVQAVGPSTAQGDNFG